MAALAMVISTAVAGAMGPMLDRLLGAKQAEPVAIKDEEPRQPSRRASKTSTSQAKLFRDPDEAKRFGRLVSKFTLLGHGDLTGAEFSDVMKQGYIDVCERLNEDGIKNPGAHEITRWLDEHGLLTRACSIVGSMIDEKRRSVD
jgi:hypothetical protein